MIRSCRLVARLLVTALCTSLLGCAGYTIGYIKPAAYTAVSRIYIPTFSNDTLEPRSAVMVTNAVIQRFQRDGTYEIGSVSNSDAVLEGTIKEVHRRQARSTRYDTLRTSEIDFSIIVEYQFRDLRTNEILHKGVVSGETSQFLDSNFQLSERQALPLAAERMASNLVSRLSEGW